MIRDISYALMVMGTILLGMATFLGIVVSDAYNDRRCFALGFILSMAVLGLTSAIYHG